MGRGLLKAKAPGWRTQPGALSLRRGSRDQSGLRRGTVGTEPVVLEERSFFSFGPGSALRGVASARTPCGPSPTPSPSPSSPFAPCRLLRAAREDSQADPPAAPPAPPATP